MRTPIQAHPVFRNSPAAGRGVAALLAARIAPSDLCATATVDNGQVCINVPVLGQKCISGVPAIFNGRSASLCADICTGHFGIPKGVCLTAKIGSTQIGQHCFGTCSV